MKKQVIKKSNSVSRDRKIAGYLIICFAVFWTICGILGVFGFFRSLSSKEDSTLVASAESPTTGELTNNALYLNLFQGFPSDIPYVSSVSNDLENGTTTITFGTMIGQTTVALHKLVPDYVPERFYSNLYISADIVRSDSNIGIEFGYYDYGLKWSNVGSSLSKPFSVLGRDTATTVNGSLYQLRFTVGTSVTTFPCTITFRRIAIYAYGSQGDYVYYPSQDVLIPNIYEEGSTEGYEIGYQQGLSAGYADGYSVGYADGVFDEGQRLTAGIFANSTLAVDYNDYVDFSGSTVDYSVDDYDYTLDDGFIDFMQFRTFFESNVGYQQLFRTALFTFDYGENLIYTLDLFKELRFVGINAYPNFYITVRLDGGGNVRLNFVRDNDIDVNTYRLDFSNVDGNQFNMFVQAFWFEVSSDDFSFELGSSRTQYLYGYADGYNDGYRVGYEYAYGQADEEIEFAYDEGLNDGIGIGYNQGFEDGAEKANVYTFTRLLSSVVDVPVNAFRSMFNFELLGVNLANFGFAILSVCLVLAVIKFIL